MKLLWLSFMGIGLNLLAAVPALAEVKINEFSSGDSSDWVELYNDSDNSADLTTYYLTDGANNQVTFTCQLAPHGFWAADWSNKLNNSGDIIKLNHNDQTVDCVTYGGWNDPLCLDQTAPTLPKLNEGEFGTRNQDGQDNWIVKNSHTKDAPNNGSSRDPAATCFLPSPSPANNPSPSPQPSSSPAGITSSVQSGPNPLPPASAPADSPLTALASASAATANQISRINLISLATPTVLGTESAQPNNDRRPPDWQLITMLLTAGTGLLITTAFIIIRLWRKSGDYGYRS